MIEYCLIAVCPALSHCVSRKKEAVFIYTADCFGKILEREGSISQASFHEWVPDY